MFVATTLNGIPGGNVSTTFVQSTGSNTCSVAGEEAGAGAGNGIAGNAGNPGRTGSGRSRGSKGSAATDVGTIGVGVGLGVTTGI